MKEVTTMAQLARVATPIGPRIRIARENAGMSRKQLAHGLGVDPGAIRAWERDERTPRANRLTMLAGVLNVSLSWLLEGREDRAMSDDGDATTAEVREELEQIAGLLASAQQRLETLRARVTRPADDAATGD